MKIVYEVVEVYYNESSSNDEEVLFTFDNPKTALTKRDKLSENLPHNTDYIVIVDYGNK